MKKFLKKLPVMVTLVVLAVAILALNIGMLARPVSTGMAYKNTEKEENTVVTTTFTFKNNKVLKMKMSTDKGSSELEYWVYRKGNDVVIVGMKKASSESAGVNLMTEEAYKNAIKVYEDDNLWETAKKAGFHINAYKLTANASKDNSATCNGAIAYTVVMGLVEIALITFATLSVVYYVKGGKKTSKKKSK